MRSAGPTALTSSLWPSATPDARQRSTKNLDIEALRAYAIAITIVAHFVDLVPSWNPWLGYFWLGGGVDLFFAVSGFVITRSLVTTSRRSEPHRFLAFAVPFWIRRVFRLWPAAILCSGVTLALAYGFNHSGAFGLLSEISVTAAFGLIQFVNLRLVLCANHYWLSCGGDALWHYWSLSLEEQFYIVFPILFFFLSRRHLLVAVLFGVAAQFLLERPWPSLAWFYRTDAILLGIAIALFESQRWHAFFKATVTRHPGLTRIVSTAAWVMLIVLATPNVAFFYHGLVALTAASLVLIASADSGLAIPVPGWRPALVWVGARSYSIYLFHMPLFRMSREVTFRAWGAGELSTLQNCAAVLLGLGVTVLASETSFRFVENPSRDFGRKLSARLQVR